MNPQMRASQSAEALDGLAGDRSAPDRRDRYQAAVDRIWRIGTARDVERNGLQLELVRYATLAPSSHNTQCWKFVVRPQAISIAPDFSRRCPVVDPDDHHLWVSLGCATENLLAAAAANGLQGEEGFDAACNGLRVSLGPGAVSDSPRFRAITRRQSTRAEYDGKPLAAGELRELQQAASGAGVHVLLLTDELLRGRVLDLVIQGNTAQMNDPAFVSELRSWIRFSAADALRCGDGLFASSSGNPRLPGWLGRRIFPLVFRWVRRTTRSRGSCAVRPGSRCSSALRRTRRPGSRWAAPTSGLRCRPPRWACVPRI
jgi:hypothetical protein